MQLLPVALIATAIGLIIASYVQVSTGYGGLAAVALVLLLVALVTRAGDSLVPGAALSRPDASGHHGGDSGYAAAGSGQLSSARAGRALGQSGLRAGHHYAGFTHGTYRAEFKRDCSVAERADLFRLWSASRLAIRITTGCPQRSWSFI